MELFTKSYGSDVRPEILAQQEDGSGYVFKERKCQLLKGVHIS